MPQQERKFISVNLFFLNITLFEMFPIAEGKYGDFFTFFFCIFYLEVLTKSVIRDN